MLMDDYWLAGFIDGEGCFTRHSQAGPNGSRVKKPKFVIGLREDDAAILYALREEFGGSIHVRNAPSQREGNRRPTVIWTLTGRSLPGLVKYLERFPLRAKKGDQFKTWRAEHGL